HIECVEGSANATQGACGMMRSLPLLAPRFIGKSRGRGARLEGRRPRARGGRAALVQHQGTRLARSGPPGRSAPRNTPRGAVAELCPPRPGRPGAELLWTYRYRALT